MCGVHPPVKAPWLGLDRRVSERTVAAQGVSFCMWVIMLSVCEDGG